MLECVFRHLLRKADVDVSGGRPWDMLIRDSRVFRRIFCSGSLGLGEAYMDGWWDCENLAAFFARILAARLDRYARVSPIAIGGCLANVFANAARRHPFQIGEIHYDLGNDFFRAMLGETMAYSCAYWRQGATTLASAQEAKLDLVCRKLGLKKGQRVLDIGCGWGSFAKFAAERYGASVVGITVSTEQAEFAQAFCAELPVEIRFQDFRDVDGKFDHIVSIGMFEHVESKNYADYFRAAERCLLPGGIFLLHTIGKKRGRTASDPWIRKYIFPVGMIPRVKQIRRAAEGAFHILDWHIFGGSHYDRTLSAWHERFSANWSAMGAKYGPMAKGKFERMWRYYLFSCAGAFRAGALDVWQIALARDSLSCAPVR